MPGGAPVGFFTTGLDVSGRVAEGDMDQLKAFCLTRAPNSGSFGARAMTWRPSSMIMASRCRGYETFCKFIPTLCYPMDHPAALHQAQG